MFSTLEAELRGDLLSGNMFAEDAVLTSQLLSGVHLQQSIASDDGEGAEDMRYFRAARHLLRETRKVLDKTGSHVHDYTRRAPISNREGNLIIDSSV